MAWVNRSATRSIRILTVTAPELTIDKRVTPSSNLRTGDPITYTIVVSNSGDVTAQGVIVSDTLPASVSGSNLNTTIDLAVGEHRHLYDPGDCAGGRRATPSPTVPPSATPGNDAAIAPTLPAAMTCLSPMATTAAPGHCARRSAMPVPAMPSSALLTTTRSISTARFRSTRR